MKWMTGLLTLLASAQMAAGGSIDYVRDVKPILKAHCTSCHGAVRQKGKLRLDAVQLIRRGGVSGEAIAAGQSDESLLIDRVTAEDAQDRMPPESEGVALSAEELGVLRSWIDGGAKAADEKVPDDPRRHWAYQVPERPAVPRSSDACWVRNPIDAFVSAHHRERGLKPSPDVSKELWLRRVYLDLIGLPPSRAELHAFREDNRSDSYERVVDRLLASPRYGERWGRHWMDVWRYSDWYGLGQELRFSHPHIWRWRDWIVESLNIDKGYDRMIVEMLAGDEVAPDDPNTLRATGFLARNWDIFNRNTWLGNTVEHTARAFLGLTIQCARCHDHKFDPITQRDYFRLRAFFEPYHLRIDRVPGQPDRTKDGLARAFDDFLATPTYLFVRGDEARPDKKSPLTPATPAVLGGRALEIKPIALSLTASSPDKREFVIGEARELAEKAVADARAALERSKHAVGEATRALASAEKAVEDTQAAFSKVAANPGAAKPARDAAVRAVEGCGRARKIAQDASDAVRRDEVALAVAEARKAALLVVLTVEHLEDDGAKQSASSAWTEAAQAASAAERRQAMLEADYDRLVASQALSRAQSQLEGLSSLPADPKNSAVPAHVQKAAGEVVDARAKLADAKARLAKAEAAAKETPPTAYTPRPLTFHRAKTTYRDVPSNAPYSRTSTGRRLALARWIVDGNNPLTARVAVNHIWARHFGEPLVGSMFDFGLRTAEPEYRGLLDWLAVELMESGWSTKHLHRLIVTSRAYQMSTSGTADGSQNAAIDPDNHGLWRMSPRRMEAEVIRDSLLLLAGQLDFKMGGPDLPVASAEEGTRRTIYYRYARDDRIPLLTMFDAPNVEECYRRDETIVPQQALALSNSGMVLKRAGEIADAISREVGDGLRTRRDFVSCAFERLLGRAPAENEANECARALERLQAAFASEKTSGASAEAKARAALVHVLLNHSDFVAIR